MTKKKAPAKKVRKKRVRPIDKTEIVLRAYDKADVLLRAVGNYVEQYGGKVIVAGPISLMNLPEDREHVFHVVVKCLGRKPTAPGE
jgi:DUF1009 family protein